MLGKKITKCEQITKLALAKKSLFHTRINKRITASWVENMPVRLIVGWIRMSWLYEYKPIKK